MRHSTSRQGSKRRRSPRTTPPSRAEARPHPERRPAIDAKIAKYEQQKRELKAHADALEAASAKADRESAELSRPHARIAGSLIALQIAISLASITALTGRRWLFGAALVSAAVGVVVWLGALAHLGLVVL